MIKQFTQTIIQNKNITLLLRAAVLPLKHLIISTSTTVLDPTL